MNWVKTEFGYECKGTHYHMFFGNARCDQSQLKKLFPEYEFRFLKQVHGNKCVASSPEEAEADAHYTAEKKIALCIRTADCTPILISTENTILAIHAGWRGVMNGVLAEGLKHIHESFDVAMGPHIQKQSFQVDISLGNEFGEKYGSQYVFQNTEHPDKLYVDLSAILQLQLNESPQKKLSQWVSDLDTLTNSDFHSHRRDAAAAGRNISFVARL
jgi:YfiH family protein